MGGKILMKGNEAIGEAAIRAGCLNYFAYIARQALIRPKYIIKAKKSIKKAFTYQVENRCFSLVELVSLCPTNWGMTPVDAAKWAEDNMLTYYPLGELKTPEMNDSWYKIAS